MDDPIISELRKVKQALAKRYGYDLEKLCEALRKEQAQSDAEVVSFPPKRLQKGRKAVA